MELDQHKKKNTRIKRSIEKILNDYIFLINIQND
jgi:hypothetical protein